MKTKTKNKQNIDAIYIHIPFCNKKCEYCDFCTFVNMEKEYRKYVDYLIKEIKMYPEYEYNTIYFGGGTPSLLPIEMLKEIMNELKWSENAEITLELNPTDMTFEKLLELRKIGINRLSIGIQSFQNHVLKFIGREHNSQEAMNTYKMARNAGFDNITIDLMFGIPNQTIEDLHKDLAVIKEILPENVSIYSLIWEEGTVFWSKLQKGILSEIDQDIEAQMYEIIIDFFEKNGYCHYEISNFSRIDKPEIKNINSDFERTQDINDFEKDKIIKENFEDLQQRQKNGGQHNLKYWRNQEFIGVGMSAASFYENNRHNNTKIFRKYYEFLDNGKLPIDEKSIEVVDEIEREKLKKILGFRLVNEGIEYFENEKIENFLKDGMLEIFEVKSQKFNKIKKIRLTKKGVFLANDIFMEFI